jgi:hypothetical protein
MAKMAMPRGTGILPVRVRLAVPARLGQAGYRVPLPLNFASLGAAERKNRKKLVHRRGVLCTKR